MRERQRAELQNIVNAQIRWMTEQGVGMTISRNYDELRAFGIRQSGFINPTFDPSHRAPGDEDMWCQFTDRMGQTVASMAFAYFPQTIYHDLIVGGRLWYDRPPDDWDSRLQIDTGCLKAVGDIVHAGAIMIAREWTHRHNKVDGARFSNRMIRLSRATWLLHYTADWWTGCIPGMMIERQISTYAHGITPESCPEFMSGYLPMLGREDRLHAMQVPVPEIINTLIDEAVIDLSENR